MFDDRRVQARYILVLWEYIGERTIINQQNLGTEWKKVALMINYGEQCLQ